MMEPGEIRKIIRESLAVILAAMILGFAVNLFHPRGFSLTGKTAARYGKINRVNADEAKIKYDCGAAIFIDARDLGEYTAERIPGALHVPAEPESLSLNAIRSQFEIISQQKETVIYCGGSTCGDSETLARRLLDMDYPRTVYILESGFPGWAGKNYPVTRGTE